MWSSKIYLEFFSSACQAQAELAESLEVDHTNFKMFESVKNDSKARTMGAISVEAERHQTASCHVNSCFSGRKRKVFASYHDQ